MPITLGGSNGLAYLALRDLGVLPKAAMGASPDLLNDILLAANQMLDAWLLNKLYVPWQQLTQFTTIGGSQFYCIGPNETATRFINGQTFNPVQATRPIKIEYCDVILNTFSPPVRQPVEILEDDKDWERIRVQQIPTAIPLKLYYDKSANPDGHGGAFALMYFWPGPQSSYQIELLQWEPLQQFPALLTAITVPPGYQRLIQKQLAVEIAPLARMYAKELYENGLKGYDPAMLARVEKQAAQAKREVEQYNAPWARPIVDYAYFGGSGRAGGFNYGTGDVGRTA